jgi:hypothetical protein
VSERRPLERVSRVGGSPTLVLVATAGMVIALAVAMNRSTYDIWGAFWVGPALFALTVPIAHRIARVDNDPGLGRLILGAFVAKVIGGAVLRYAMVYGVYGSGDSERYDLAGRVLAPLFRHGDYTDLGKVTGTRFTELLTGQVYAVIGPTRLGGFLVFSWLAFLGLVLMVRAFQLAVPEGDQRRYQVLVLFFPTLLFWPSSIGKDAWMLLCLGLLAYGLARILTGNLLGGLPAAVGLWGAGVVRPHIALLVILAAVLATAVRVISPSGTGSGPRHRVGTLLGGAVLVVGVVFVMGQAEQFFHLDKLDAESAESVLTETTRRTGQGGSEFHAGSAANPIGYGKAVATVLLRPFPFEAHGALALVSSGEGTLLAIVIAASLTRLARVPAYALRHPYVLFGLVYTLGFVYAFSSIENFGILARQRAQVLPFLFIVLALPAKPRKKPSLPPTVARRSAAAVEPAA